MATVQFVSSDFSVLTQEMLRETSVFGFGSEGLVFLDPAPNNGQLTRRRDGAWLTHLVYFEGHVWLRYECVQGHNVPMGEHLSSLGEWFRQNYGSLDACAAFNWFSPLKPVGRIDIVTTTLVLRGGPGKLEREHGLREVGHMCLDLLKLEAYIAGERKGLLTSAISFLAREGVGWDFSFSPGHWGELTTMSAVNGQICWAMRSDDEDPDEVFVWRAGKRLEFTAPEQDECDENGEWIDPVVWRVAAIITTPASSFLVQDMTGKVYEIKPDDEGFAFDPAQAKHTLEPEEYLVQYSWDYANVYNPKRGTFWRLKMA